MGSIGTTISNVLGFGPAQQQQDSGQQQQSQAAGTQGQIASALAGPLSSYYGGAMGDYAALNGFNSATGTFDPSFDPYAQTGNSLISKYEEGVAPQYDNAVSSATHDLMGRGFTGANSITPSEVGNIRQAQASDNANFQRNLGVDATNQRYSDMGSFINTLLGSSSAATGANSAASNMGAQQVQQGQQQAQNSANNVFSVLGMFGL